MSYIKRKEEIQMIKKGGRELGRILEHLASMAEPGVSVAEIDEKAEEMILEIGGRPTFKGYKPKPGTRPFPSTICASVNEEIVHGIAKEDKILQNCDIFTIDVGMEWPVEESKQDVVNSFSQNGGFINDTAVTVAVGDIDEDTEKLLNRTQQSLYKGIEQARAENTVADIGKTIEEYIDQFGYGIVRDLCGHGVGHEIHEEPNVFNFYDKSSEKYKLRSGVVIAIEPMIISSGEHRIKTADDGWSIESLDGSLSAHYEHTVIITEDGPEIATKRPNEEI